MSGLSEPLALATRVVASRPRLFAGVACGLVAAAGLRAFVATTMRWIIAWDIGASVFLVLSLLLFLTEPHENMPAHAAAQEEGEWTIFAITIGVITASFAAIVGEFAQASNLHGTAKTLHIGLVAITLLLSWLMMQFTLALRYAHEYYAVSDGALEVDGGLNFPGEKNPDYMDFLYFSLVLGMTFQVSDVAITSRKLRRLAALQGFLGFVFNTVILALTVNLAAGLL